MTWEERNEPIWAPGGDTPRNQPGVMVRSVPSAAPSAAAPSASDRRRLRDGTPLVVPFDYVGAPRDAVLALKNGRDRRSVRSLAEAMAGLISPLAVPDATVTWAPTSPARRRRRGYDQAEILARAVAARLGLGCRPTLQRRPGPSQEGRDRRRRLEGPRFDALWVPSRVIVVDDVVTTGATLSAAAGVLTGAGAEVLCAAAATFARPNGSGG